MRTGGLSFVGGTAMFGGGEDAEHRYYSLLQRWLGRGAYDKDDDTIRSGFLMAMARMLATMESEARKQKAESVPRTSIDQNAEWQSVYGLKYLSGVYGDLYLAQRFLSAIQRFTCATPNIVRIENEVGKIMDAAKPLDGGDGVEGFENTMATAISDDGVKYYAILVPWSIGYGHGQWLVKKANRPLYRAIKRLLQLISPAHTTPALCTADIAASPNRPAFYTDGWKGSACDKDCVGS